MDGMSRVDCDLFRLQLERMFHASLKTRPNVSRDLCGNYQTDAEYD